MVKLKFFPVYLLIILLFLPVVLAVKPSTPQFSSNVGNLQVISIKNNVYKFNSTFELYFHVYDSYGSPLNNSRSQCKIHIYNPVTNYHIVEESLTNYESVEFELAKEKLFNISNTIGIHPYIVWCNGTSVNNTKEYGFVSDEIEINNNGNYEVFSMLDFAIIFLPLLFGLLLGLFCLSLGEDHTILKIFMLLIAILSFFISLGISILDVGYYTNFTDLNNNLSAWIYVYGTIYVLFVLYFIIYAISKIMNMMEKDKEQKLNY